MDRQMLEGKVAPITGASYGMGQTMAEGFSPERGRGGADPPEAEGRKLDSVVEGVSAEKGSGAISDHLDVLFRRRYQEGF